MKKPIINMVWRLYVLSVREHTLSKIGKAGKGGRDSFIGGANGVFWIAIRATIFLVHRGSYFCIFTWRGWEFVQLVGFWDLVPLLFFAGFDELVRRSLRKLGDARIGRTLHLCGGKTLCYSKSPKMLCLSIGLLLHRLMCSGSL
jgi:hypothetical protein